MIKHRVKPIVASRAVSPLTLPPPMKSPTFAEEKEYLRNYFMEPMPRVIQEDKDEIQSFSVLSANTPSVSKASTSSSAMTPNQKAQAKPPAAPKKKSLARSYHVRQGRADDIVETAQHLMDLCITQKRCIENMEKTFDELLFGTDDEMTELDEFAAQF